MAKIEFENLKDHLQSIADQAVKYGQERYPDIEIESFVDYGYESEISIEHGLPKATDGFSGGLGIRIAKDKRIGFASATGLDLVKETVDEAFATMSAINAPDIKFEGFADPIKGNSSDGDIYKPLLEITSADLIESVNQITTEAQEIDKRIISVTGESGIAYGGFAVANSRGINVGSLNLASFIVIQAVAQSAEKRKIGFEFDVSRSRPLQWEGLAKKAGKHAVKLLETIKLDKSSTMKTIWEPRVCSNFFLNSLGYSLNGRAVVEGRSRFADRIGEQVAQTDFTLIDDGQISDGLNTSAFDGEGVIRQKTSLVENGTLKHFLFDSYYARVFGTNSTGNASRKGSGSTPTTGISTLVIKPGNNKPEQLIAEIDEGIMPVDYVMGLGHSDPISGDFSLVAPQSFYIKNGEIAGSLEPVTFAGNFYTALNHLEICNDPVLTPWNIKCPTVIFNNFSVSG